MIIQEGGITSPKGFRAAGGHIGLKKFKKDLALISSDAPATAAGVFTANNVKAAPVLWDMRIVQGGAPVRGIVVNSGNANACTAEQGQRDTENMAQMYANLLDVSREEILVCSTGVIGVPLPMDIIQKGIQNLYPTLDCHPQNAAKAAEAILTTDTFPKVCALEIELDGKPVRIAGMAKGSGMIHPNMATMLSFITTDAHISKELLQEALRESAQDSYNMISVDGDTSTNDTVLVLSNGMAENTLIEYKDKNYELFKTTLHELNVALAQSIARDGEGATKLIEATVNHAKTKEDARKIARSVISSNLLKTAIFGSDANWGRVLCAMGYSGGNFDINQVDIIFRSRSGKIPLMSSGSPLPFDEILARQILNEKEIYIDIHLQEGSESAVAWGCDLSYDYIKINGEYRS